MRELKEVMVFKRVLHPVGQGAFFTEQFFDNASKAVFNVVYDCGEYRTSKHLDKEIENTLNATGAADVIDVMFISHLDDDHINGIDHLINIRCLTNRSTVILPLNYPLVIKLILEQEADALRGLYPDDALGVLQRLFDTGAKILGIDNNNDGVLNNTLPLDDIQGLPNYGAVRSMQPMMFKSLWYYIPFNTILDDDRYKIFQEGLDAAQIDRSQLTNADYVRDNLDKLIDIYKKLPKGIGHLTAINVNSLNVLSYASNEIYLGRVWLNNFGSDVMWRGDWDGGMVYRSRCSCLYTGDCVMEAKFEHCIDLLVKHITTWIGMLQIPHHGRAGNYDRKIACKREIYSGFTNFNSTHKANKFVKQIVHDFAVTGRLFFQITEHFHSRMELYVHLMVEEDRK